MNAIRQIFSYAENEYNCSARTDEEWMETGTKWPILSCYLLVTGSLLVIFYITSLYAMWKLKLVKYSCYRIMFALGVMDMMNIVNNSIVTGYLAMYGFVFCSSPFWMYLQGVSNITFWSGVSMLYVLLAINRVSAVTEKFKLFWLFEAFGGWMWLIPMALYAVFCGVVLRPLPFSSKIFAATFVPYIEENFKKQESDLYENPSHKFNNILVSIVLMICYSYVIVFMMKNRSRMGVGTEVKVVVQSLLISIPTFFVCNVYTYFQLFEADPILIIIGHLAWHWISGLPALIYLFINGDIRRFYLPRQISQINPIYLKTYSTSMNTVKEKSGNA